MLHSQVLSKLSGLQAVGGYTALQTKYLAAIPEKLMDNSTCGIPRVDSWRMLRDANPSVSDLPWPAFLLGQMPASIWYWCTDQVSFLLFLTFSPFAVGCI